MYSKLIKEKILRKVTESIYVFLTTPDGIKKYFEIIQLNSSDKYVHRYSFDSFNTFGPELQLFNTKLMTKNKLKRFLGELEKFGRY